MRCLPDRFVEPIRIYRAATVEDDPTSDNYFEDEFAPEGDPYSDECPVRAGWKITDGHALGQHDRISIYRRSERVDVDAIAFYNNYFVVRDLDRELPEIDYGLIPRETSYYLLRMKESPDFLNRHTIVYHEHFPNGFLIIYTADERDANRTFVTL